MDNDTTLRLCSFFGLCVSVLHHTSGLCTASDQLQVTTYSASSRHLIEEKANSNDSQWNQLRSPPL